MALLKNCGDRHTAQCGSIINPKSRLYSLEIIDIKINCSSFAVKAFPSEQKCLVKKEICQNCTNV
jgi:hypothetical protein